MTPLPPISTLFPYTTLFRSFIGVFFLAIAAAEGQHVIAPEPGALGVQRGHLLLLGLGLDLFRDIVLQVGVELQCAIVALVAEDLDLLVKAVEIGRASCRERV